MASTKTFNTTAVLATFRTTRNGDFFAIQDGAIFSLNKYTFDQFAVGNYTSITYEVTDQDLPASNDANGNPRPPLKQTVVKEVATSERTNKLKEIDDAQLDYQLKDIKKKTKDLGDVL